MASPPLASVDDLDDWLETPVTNVVRAEVMLQAASTAVRAYTGRTYLTTVSDDDDTVILDTVPDEASIVTLMIAERLLMKPPDGMTQESLGAYGSSFSRSGIYLTAEEKAMLDGPATLTSVKVTTPAFPMDYHDLDELAESDTVEE